MKFLRGLHAYDQSACVATIGNFDGLHLGHQRVISSLKEKADQLGLPLTVISFEPLPAEFFAPNPPARIYPLRDKVRMLKQLGVDYFLCLKFDSAFANMAPEAFVEKILLDSMNVRYLTVGDDFRFGCKRTGDFKLLKEIGTQNGMDVTDTPTCEQQGERVSSTRIRKLLETAQLQSANSLLGHSYQLSGRVRHGDKRGRTIGFPTLNMKVPTHIAPKRGVYAVRVAGLDGSLHDDSKQSSEQSSRYSTVLNGVANIGTRPTVNGTETRLETHLFDYQGDAYGKYVCVELVEFLREERSFDNFELLKAQILKDAEQAKALFAD